MTSRRRFLTAVGAVTAGGVGIVGYDRLAHRDRLLEFGEGVPRDVREQGRRVERRLPDLLGREPVDRVSVEMADDSRLKINLHGRGTRDELLDAARHRPEAGPDTSTAAGIYNSADRRILLGSDPNEPLIAHEFTHAVQFDHFSMVSPGRQSRDQIRARTAVLEGTATYVQSLYTRFCDVGNFDPCVPGVGEAPNPEALEDNVDRVLPYLHGGRFIRIVQERCGWDGVWSLHDYPPESTHSISFPQRYLNTPVTPVEINRSLDAPAEWFEVVDDRLGVFGLYATLVWLGIESLEFPQVADQLTAIIFEDGGTVASERLASWRGDRLVGYNHIDDDRLLFEWTTEWESVEEAEAFATGITSAYDNRGRNHDQYWHLDGRWYGVAQNETEVTVTMASSRDDYEQWVQ